MPIEKVLILEDDRIQLDNLRDILRDKKYIVSGATTIARADEYLASDNYDLILVDLNLPDGNGLDFVRRLQMKPSRPLSVVMTSTGSIDSAVDCIQAGAFHYLVKPLKPAQLHTIISKAEDLSRLLSVNRFLTSPDHGEERFALLGESPAMRTLRANIDRVGKADATVLIQGESGTGKELVARALFAHSSRVGHPFIRVNCASVPESLIESEFFGHEKGAFTGAIVRREGRFELAHKGTILLDEVSEVSPTVQAKLLRVLQEQEFERIGGKHTLHVDVRVIATTNRNMEESISRKEFRADLFYRLNVVPLFVPPLRERMEDVPQLAQAFIKRSARQHGRDVIAPSEACLDALMSHTWPGNVRELQNVIERGVIMCDGSELLEPVHLGFGRRDAPVSSSPAHIIPFQPPVEVFQPQASKPVFKTPETVAPAPATGMAPLDEIEKQHILATLHYTNGNRTRAADILKISIRTLRNKLNEYGYTAGGSGHSLAE